MNTLGNIPNPSAPFLSADGRISPVWWQFLITLFTRTGGNLGISTDALQAAIAALQAASTADKANIAGLLTQANDGVQPAALKQDERGEAGDGAMLAQLLVRLAHAEGSMEPYRADDALRARIADLEAKVDALGAHAPMPAGYDTTTINATPRLIAYY